MGARRALNDVTALKFSRNSGRRDAVTVWDVQSRRHRSTTNHSVHLESAQLESRRNSMRIRVVVSRCVWWTSWARGEERLFPKSPLISRYQAICPRNTTADCAAKFIRDVDHHARACWWSTSESSEKCPRVTRGTMSVPSDCAVSADLIGICEEIVAALSQCINFGKVRSRRRA